MNQCSYYFFDYVISNLFFLYFCLLIGVDRTHNFSNDWIRTVDLCCWSPWTAPVPLPIVPNCTCWFYFPGQDWARAMHPTSDLRLGHRPDARIGQWHYSYPVQGWRWPDLIQIQLLLGCSAWQVDSGYQEVWNHVLLFRASGSSAWIMTAPSTCLHLCSFSCLVNSSCYTFTQSPDPWWTTLDSISPDALICCCCSVSFSMCDNIFGVHR